MSSTLRKLLSSDVMRPTPARKAWMVSLDNLFRRIIDILGSILGIILLSPLFFWIAFRIRKDSPGPIFFKGARAGRGGKTFNILKFRTMYEDQDSYKGPRVTARGDSRITPFGRWLRDTKVNELPQLWNVLRGEMSMVGPRPEDPGIAADWPAHLNEEILSVRPGITSPASVLYRNEEELLNTSNLMDRYLKEILPSKLRLDQLYIRNRNILADMDVIFWTIVLLLPRLKGYSIPEHLLYRGPMSLIVGRYLSWFIVDILVSFGSIGTAGVIWRLNAPLDLGVTLALGVAVVFALLFSLFNTIFGSNRVDWSRARAGEVLDLGLSSMAVSLIVFFFNLIWFTGPLLPPSMLLLASTFSFIGSVAVRYRLRLLTGLAQRLVQLRGNTMRFYGERVLIIGAGELGLFAISLLRTGHQADAFSVVGMLDDDPRKIGNRIGGTQVIGRLGDIPNIVRKYDIGLIVYAISNITPEEQKRILAWCHNTQARTIIIPDLLMAFRALLPEDAGQRDVLLSRVLENSTIDRETGANNRHHFLRVVEGEIPRSKRYGRPLSLILFEVDSQETQQGQDRTIRDAEVLQLVVDRAQKTLRTVDVLGRYDDKHFAVLLPETTLPAARQVVTRLRESITSEPVAMGYTSLRLNLRAGVVVAGDSVADAASLIYAAEKVME